MLAKVLKGQKLTRQGMSGRKSTLREWQDPLERRGGTWAQNPCAWGRQFCCAEFLLCRQREGDGFALYFA